MLRSMTIDPEAANIGSRIADNAAQGIQSGVTASTALTSLLPAGAEEVSAQAVLAFTTEAAHLLALNKAAQEELLRAGSAITAIAQKYADVDATAAGALLGVGFHRAAG